MTQTIKTIFLDAISTYRKLLSHIGSNNKITGMFIWCLLAPVIENFFDGLGNREDVSATITIISGLLLIIATSISTSIFGLFVRTAVMNDISLALKVNIKWAIKLFLVSILGTLGHILLVCLALLLICVLLIPLKLTKLAMFFALSPILLVFFFISMPALSLYATSYAIEKPIKFFNSFRLVFGNYRSFLLYTPIVLLFNFPLIIIPILLSKGYNLGTSPYLLIILMSLWGGIFTPILDIIYGSCYKHNN